MKITKQQLNQIIEEETKNLVDEGFMDLFRKKEEPEPEPEPEAEAEVDERGAPLDGYPRAQEDRHWGFPAIWVQWMQGSFRKGEDGEYDKEALQKLWKWGADPVHGAIWKWDNEKEGYVATGYQGQAGFGSMWAALVPENGETAKAAFNRWVHWNRKNKRDLEQHRAEREEEERMNPGGDEGEEYEWRRGDMRVKRRHRAKSLYENKITKQQLKQIIKEELEHVLNEENSPMEILGIHDISDSKILINAVRGLLDQGGINDDITARTIEKWLSGSLQKEPDEALRSELTNLRDETLRVVGFVGREGKTGYERRRARSDRYRDEAGLGE